VFVEIKRRMISVPVMRFPDFFKFFEVACDASDIGIGGVLAQKGHPVAYFNEKLNNAKQKYSTYYKQFYAVIQALRYWRFIFFPDLKALKYIYSQKK